MVARPVGPRGLRIYLHCRSEGYFGPGCGNCPKLNRVGRLFPVNGPSQASINSCSVLTSFLNRFVRPCN